MTCLHTVGDPVRKKGGAKQNFNFIAARHVDGSCDVITMSRLGDFVRMERNIDAERLLPNPLLQRFARPDLLQKEHAKDFQVGDYVLLGTHGPQIVDNNTYQVLERNDNRLRLRHCKRNFDRSATIHNDGIHIHFGAYQDALPRPVKPAAA